MSSSLGPVRRTLECVTVETFPEAADCISEAGYPPALARIAAIYAIGRKDRNEPIPRNEQFLVELAAAGVNHFTPSEIAQLGLTHEHVRASKALIIACSRGHLGMARWLTDHLRLGEIVPARQSQPHSIEGSPS